MILNIQPLTGSRVQNLELSPDEVLATTEPPALRFYGAKEPKQPLQVEKAHHRTAAYMLAAGAKIRAVADALDVAESTVRNWTRQPFFQSLLATILHNEFSGDISQMLKTMAVEAVLVQSDLMHNSMNDQVKLKAAQDILDRYRGKPTSFVHHTGSISEDPAVEIRRLEEELKLTETRQN